MTVVFARAFNFSLREANISWFPVGEGLTRGSVLGHGNLAFPEHRDTPSDVPHPGDTFALVFLPKVERILHVRHMPLEQWVPLIYRFWASILGVSR
jgi:hypothetical protein